MERSSEIKKIQEGKVRVLLVRPVTAKDRVLNVVPPIGLGYLASAIKDVDTEVDILDCVASGYDLEKFSRHIKDFKPDIIGFQAFSHDVSSVNASIAAIKKINPNIVTIVGGAHPSGVGAEVFEHIPCIDFAFIGESETGLHLLVNYISKSGRGVNAEALSRIPGLIWKNVDNKITANPPDFVENLDALKFPSWDLINPAAYPMAPQGLIFKNFPIAPLILTRGCPFLCTFCAGYTISGRKIRRRSIENIFKEITLLYNDYNIREFHILDDNFTFTKDFAKQFCLEILKRNLKFSWCCPNGIRLDTLDEELVTLMKRSGCYYISVGIESGSDKVLKDMKKSLNKSQVIKQISLIRKCGLRVNGFFIIGYPTETVEDIKKTIGFGSMLPLTRAQFFSFLPLPGTEIYNELKSKGIITKLDWDNFFESVVCYTPPGLTKRELDLLLKWAHIKFYFNIKRIWSLVQDIRSLGQLKFIFRRIVSYMVPRIG